MALCVGAVPMRAARCEIQGQLIQNDGKLLRATNPEERATAHSSESDAASPRQIHEMNAVRRSQMAVRRGLADHKKITANGLVRRGCPDEGSPL